MKKYYEESIIIVHMIWNQDKYIELKKNILKINKLIINI